MEERETIRTTRSWASPNAVDGTTGVFSGRHGRRQRNPFPDEHFFPVPLRLFKGGLVAAMSGSEVKRYLTLLRLANYEYGSRKIKRDLKELGELDGVSNRRAWQVNRKLQERGLVVVEDTKPITYHLVAPDAWPEVDNTGAYIHLREGKTTRGTAAPLHWEDINNDD
jgi:hypothetical protein